MRNPGFYIKLFCLLFVGILAGTGQVNSKEIDPRPALQRIIDSPEPKQQWKGLSLLVSYHRQRGEFGILTQYLDKYLSLHPKSIHAPLLQEWIATNYSLTKDFHKSIAAYGNLIKKFGTQKVGNRSWAARALEALVDIHIAAGDQQAAIAAASQLLKNHSNEIGPAWARYRLAKLNLAIGRIKVSIPLLQEILKSHSKEKKPDGNSTVAALAQYALDLAQSNREWIHKDRSTLVGELESIFAQGDIRALVGLASPSHFHWSVLGREPLTRPFKDIKPILQEAWKISKPAPLMGATIKESTNKAYVRTTGWHSQHMTETVWLLLTKDDYGWEWNGIVLESQRPLPKTWLTSPPDPPDGQPLRFTLLAPWADGVCMLSGDPDWYVDSTYTGPDCCVDTVGWPGYYYGSPGSSHNGSDYFAIDFNRWRTAVNFCCKERILGKCVWYWFCGDNGIFTVGGDEVRSVATGKVTDRADEKGMVIIQHLDDGGNPDGYSSKYLHMRDIIVNVDQYVARGSPLGYVDDMGDSTGDHLHFALYDKKVCTQDGAICDNADLGQSVMPSPIDGVTRGTHGDLKCIQSSNTNQWADSDGDGVPDVIDNCPNKPNHDQADNYRPGGYGPDGIGDACENVDGDQWVDDKDNCPLVANNGQEDIDKDGQGDVCDLDKDGDQAECALNMHGFLVCGPASGKTDNCPDIWNAGQEDLDGDGIGDVCDDDIDGDGILNARDLCPWSTIPEYSDSDGDQVGDMCDNCPAVWNPYQQDANNDGEGDACDSDDTDGDGIQDKDDRCPLDSENKCPAKVPPLGDIVTDYGYMDYVFHTLQDKLRIEIGPCLTPLCSIQAEVTFLNFPRELKLGIFDTNGHEIVSRRTVDGVKTTVAFGVPPRQVYHVEVLPGSGVKFGKRYKLEVQTKFHYVGHIGAPKKVSKPE